MYISDRSAPVTMLFIEVRHYPPFVLNKETRDTGVPKRSPDDNPSKGLSASLVSKDQVACIRIQGGAWQHW